jgi:hypothetical protein
MRRGNSVINKPEKRFIDYRMNRELLSRLNIHITLSSTRNGWGTSSKLFVVYFSFPIAH